MKKNIALGLMLTSVILCGCSSKEAASAREMTFATKKNAGIDIVAPGLLSGADLKLDWQNDVPLAVGEKINHVVVAKEYLYIITELNTVICYERITGSLRFVKQLARPNLPMMRPSEYEGALYAVIGDELWKLDPKSATVSLRQKLVNSAVCPVIFSGENMYVAGLDNRISCYDSNENWLKFQVTADNDSRITSVVVEDEFMWFATAKGNVHCASAYDTTKHWSFNVSSRIIGDIVKSDKFIYVSSEDTVLYKINALTGALVWKAHLGSALTSSAIVYDDIVCQQSNLNGTYGIDVQSGRILWQEPNGKSFVARDERNIYIFTSDNLLSIIDNRLGKSIMKVNFSPVSLCGKNVHDGNIYVLGSSGKLAKISKKQ